MKILTCDKEIRTVTPKFTHRLNCYGVWVQTSTGQQSFAFCRRSVWNSLLPSRITIVCHWTLSNRKWKQLFREWWTSSGTTGVFVI